jgi:rhodanese-related sulfurtransferase/molybdopterin-guanine dinucleotide biosynthesis protein A
VLCGGASRRMGVDKALLRDRRGVALARRVADSLLDAGASSVCCSGGDVEALSSLGLSVLSDPEPGRGPLAGLTATLGVLAGTSHPDAIALIAACDLPALDEAVPGQLLAALVDRPSADVAVAILGGVRQVQLLALRLRVHEEFEAHVHSGQASLQGALDTASVIAVEPCAPATLIDVDDPGDLARYAAAMPVPEIDVDQLAALLDEGAYLLDVRNPDEHATAHLEAAVLVPLGELAERSDEVPTDITVYVICAVGGRSARAAEHLRTIGVDAVNVTGGMTAWIASGRPSAGQGR